MQLASTATRQPYSVNKVARRAVFTFDAGRPVFELRRPGGSALGDADLEPGRRHQNLAPARTCPDWGRRLNLPEGWRYETRALTEPLVVDTTTQRWRT